MKLASKIIGLGILAFNIISTASVQADCTPPPAGVVGWWKGDGNAVDLVAGNNGTLVNAGYTNGVVGQAFAFDPENFTYGTYTGVQIADQPAYALTNALTIEGWVRPRGNGYHIFFRGDHRPGLDPYALLMQGNNSLQFVICDASGNNVSVFTTLAYNQWVHLAATLDGGTGTLSIYTNGLLAAQTNTSIRPYGQLQANQSPGIGIGNLNDGGNNFPFWGDIDEIALYNRALSSVEIQAIYQAGAAGKCLLTTPPSCDPAPTNLVSWWPAEGNANDIIGGNNGNPSNGVAFVAGVVGQAFSFNGSNSFVQVPDSAALRLTNELTIELWIKRQQLTDDYIVNKGGDWTGGALNYGLSIAGPANGNVLHFLYANGLRGTISITDFNWHHCAVTARNGDADPIFYVDGVQQPILLRKGPATMNLYPSTQPLLIGAQIAAIASYFSGALIDELSIYNRALSQTEIQAIYAARGAGKCPLPPTVVSVTPASWYVNEGATVGYTVTAVGSPTLAYQWQFNGSDLTGETNATLTLTNVVYAQAGNYAVVVSNSGGMTTSSNVVLRVNRAPIADASATATLAISPNASNAVVVLDGSNAVVVLDGSRSSDPDGDALTYAWFHTGDASLFAAGIVAVGTLPVGTNQLTLTVNDGMASGSQAFAVEVITTSQAVDRLIAMVQSGSGHPRPLIASLRAVLAAIDRSHPIVAILQLEAFIHKVQAQLQPADPVLAAQLIADAQAIIDALNGGGTLTVGPVQITSFGHGPDGKTHLKIKGIAGRIHVVETSTNMVDWVPVGVASQSSDGDYEFDDSQTPASGALFYRVVAPK